MKFTPENLGWKLYGLYEFSKVKLFNRPFIILKDFNKEEILSKLKDAGIRVHEDWRKESPGFKFNEWEMKGVPLRLEVGPKDVENKKAVLVRRDNGEKIFVQKNEVAEKAPKILDDIQESLFNEAKAFRQENTHQVSSYDEFKKTIANKGGFVRCGWDGTRESERSIKEETKATIRVIPFDENPQKLKCIYSGKPARHEVLFAKAY